MSAALIAFLVSIGAGGFGSMVGIGGGLVIVPLLSVVLGYDVKVAIAASLIGVIATSLSASPRFVRSGIADRRLGMLLLVAAALGGLAGGVTAGYLDGRTLSLLFALLLAGVALRMLWQIRHPLTHIPVAEARRRPASSPPSWSPRAAKRSSIAPIACCRARWCHSWPATSAVCSASAAGVINVPTLSVLMRVPIRVATTTSTYMLAATATASAVVYLASGQLDPLLAAPVALGVIVGARLGARLSMRLSQDALRLAFVAVAAVFAVSMFLEFLSL